MMVNRIGEIIRNFDEKYVSIEFFKLITKRSTFSNNKNMMEKGLK